MGSTSFDDAFDAYTVSFSSIYENIEALDEDSDDELALYGVIQTIPHQLIKSSGIEAEHYLNKPLLKKEDKNTYAKF
jgi:hypothetical protein